MAALAMGHVERRDGGPCMVEGHACRRGRRFARPAARTAPAPGARARSSRRAACAPERWWGNVGAFRGARIPFRPLSVAAADNRRLASELAAGAGCAKRVMAT